MRALALQAASELGVDPEDVMQETALLLAEAAKVGALGSPKALVAYLAQEIDTIDAALAEAQRCMAP